MRFEIYGLVPGSTGSETSKELIRLWPPADDDGLAPVLTKPEIEERFRLLASDPISRDYSFVVVSPTLDGRIVAVEYPGPIPGEIADRHGRESRWLKWVFDPASTVPELAPKITGKPVQR